MCARRFFFVIAVFVHQPLAGSFEVAYPGKLDISISFNLQMASPLQEETDLLTLQHNPGSQCQAVMSIYFLFAQCA